MRKFKNLTAFAIMVAMAFCVVGCGSGTESEAGSNGVKDEVVEQEVVENPGVGDTVTQGDYDITLLEVIDSEGDDWNTPDEGKIYKLCAFEVVNNSSEELSVSSLLCFTAYCDDVSIDEDIFASSLEEAAEYEQLDGTVAPGKKLRGVIGYQVPTDFEKLEIDVELDLWSDDAVRFTINK